MGRKSILSAKAQVNRYGAPLRFVNRYPFKVNELYYSKPPKPLLYYLKISTSQNNKKCPANANGAIGLRVAFFNLQPAVASNWSKCYRLFVRHLLQNKC